MAYATIDDVLTLVPSLDGTDAEVSAEALLEAASAYVDGYTGRSWVSGTVTGEIHTARDGMIRLDHRPVGSVTSVSKRGVYLGASSTVLTSPTGYELVNAAEGQLLVNAVDGDMVTVTYVASPTVPDDIKQATAMLAAHWAGSAADTKGTIYSRIKSEGDELVYRDQKEALPANVAAILAGYRAGFIFA